MKKNILSMAALLIASAAVFTACSSDDNITSEQPANPTGKYTMTVNASKGGDATTRALTLSGSTLNATWDANEVVLVYQNGSQIGTLRSDASTTNETTLTGELNSAPNEAQNLTLYFHTNATPSYAGQDGTLAKIASTYDFCAPATIATGNFTVKGNTVSTTSSVSFGANQQSVVKFTLKDKNSETLLNAGTVRVQATAYNGYSEIFDIVFTIPDDTYTTNGNGVIYLAIKNTSSYFSDLATAIGGTTQEAIKNSCKLNITATVGSDTYTYTKNGWPFEDGKYYEIGVKMAEELKPDLLSGVFSVSSTKKVKFSKGNLRYESGTWSFFDNQYDYYTSYSADAWDKFGWSTSATTYGMNTSTENSDYSGDFKDWGATMGTGWRTLTGDTDGEWYYLFNTRSASTVGGTENGRYAKAKVNDVQGVILFPDTYTHPDGVTAPTGVNATDNTGWNGNNYSSADWTKMESAGCVFLPAAGYRDGSSVNEAGADGSGCYWSATSDGTHACYVGFGSGYLIPAGSGYLNPALCGARNYAYSVRLVRQVE